VVDQAILGGLMLGPAAPWGAVQQQQQQQQQGRAAGSSRQQQQPIKWHLARTEAGAVQRLRQTDQVDSAAVLLGSRAQ